MSNRSSVDLRDIQKEIEKHSGNNLGSDMSTSRAISSNGSTHDALVSLQY